MLSSPKSIRDLYSDYQIKKNIQQKMFPCAVLFLLEKNKEMHPLIRGAIGGKEVNLPEGYTLGYMSRKLG